MNSSFFNLNAKQRTCPIFLSLFRTKQRRHDVLHLLFLEKSGENSEKNSGQCFSTASHTKIQAILARIEKLT